MRCPRIGELPDPPAGLTGWPWTAEGEQLPESRPDGRAWPRISVVTPSFNQAEFLEATLRSVLLGGYPDLEYIVMDGGSSDGSKEIIEKYAPWLAKWESGPDGGHMAGLQKGFEASSGELMAWLNSDDMYFPWTLHTAGGIFSDLPEVDWLATGTPCQIVNAAGLLDFKQSPGYARRGFFAQKLRGSTAFIQQEGSFWRRRLWQATGAHMDKTLSHAGDFELWARFWGKADLYSTATPLGMFRMHAGQKTSEMNTYLGVARAILKRYPRQLPFPMTVLSLAGYLLKRMRPQANWFGAGARRVYYSRSQEKWESEVSYRTF